VTALDETADQTADPAPSQPTMTRAERQDLARVARMRAKLARDHAAARGAEMLADAERTLSDVFASDDVRWADVVRQVTQAVNEANREVGRVCDELGVPRGFRPSMGAYWIERGENEDPKRRAELRLRVKARVRADVKRAQAVIDTAALVVAENLIADGLTSEAAHGFLEAMPTVPELLPMLGEDEIRAITGKTLTGGAS